MLQAAGNMLLVKISTIGSGRALTGAFKMSVPFFWNSFFPLTKCEGHKYRKSVEKCERLRKKALRRNVLFFFDAHAVLFTVRIWGTSSYETRRANDNACGEGP